MDDIAKEGLSAWAMVLFVLTLAVCCFFASITVSPPQSPTIVSCKDGYIHIEKEGALVPLELSSKPVECQRLVVR